MATRIVGSGNEIWLESVQKSIQDSDTVETWTFKGSKSQIESCFADYTALAGIGGFSSSWTIHGMSVKDDGDGMASLAVRLSQTTITGTELAGYNTTYRISMVETTYDLKDHPAITGTDGSSGEGALKEVALWLATDEKLRIKDESGNYNYTDAEGESHEVEDDMAIAFCEAYTHGIRNFVRYYPVITKISLYKQPPGMTRGFLGNQEQQSGSFSNFSQDIGTYDAPDISLNGYPATNWFKSGDEWSQNADKNWTRTETWTYTPNPSSGDYGWIYEAPSD